MIYKVVRICVFIIALSCVLFAQTDHQSSQLRVLFASSSAQKSKEKFRAKTQEIVVGDRLIRAGLIRPRTEQFVVFTSKGDATRYQGTLTRTIQAFNLQGQEALRLVEKFDSSTSASVDTSVVTRKTLEPLSHQSESNAGSQAFSFSPTQISGSISLKNGDKKDINENLRERAFNIATVFDVLQSLPLAKGRSFRLPHYDPGRTFGKTELTVLALDSLELLGDKPVASWRIEMKNGTSPATTIWVSVKHQEVLGMKALLTDGSEFWRIRLVKPW